MRVLSLKDVEDFYGLCRKQDESCDQGEKAPVVPDEDDLDCGGI